MHEHASHHVMNFAVVVPAIISFNLDAPAILTYISASLPIVWYALLIGEKIYHWLNKRKP